MILVVDDEYLILFALQMGLEEMGYEVLAAGDGKEAFALYNQYKDRIKYVVTDWIMPKMSGKAFVAALRADNPHLKIIITSGYRDDPQTPSDSTLGTNYFLPKPFRTQQLLDMLEQI